MQLAPILVGLATGVTTVIGGIVAIRIKDHRHLVLGAAGGVILGVVAFDLLPEAFSGSGAMVGGIPAVMVLFVGGFLTIHVVENAIELHSGAASHYASHSHDLRPIGLLTGCALVGHSFLDGLGIGVSFTAGAAAATAMAIAVLTHDFADGFNTYTLTTLYGNAERRGVILLAADATAPLVGAVVGSLLHLSTEVVSLYLAYFAGFLLYIATGTILPEAHADHPSWGTLVATVAGVVVMGCVMAVIG